MRFSSEWWAFWAGVWAVGLTAFAAIAGCIAWYFSNIAAEESAARTAALELAIAQQQERAAKAEESLLLLQHMAGPRFNDHKAFLETLKLIPPAGPVEIVFKPEDEEAHGVAVKINRWLGPGVNGDGAGWNISAVRPMNDSDVIFPDPADAPLAVKAGAWYGVALMVRQIPKPDTVKAYIWPYLKPAASDPPAPVLQFALMRAGVSVPSMVEVKSMPEGTIRIVIGAKPN